VDKAGEIAGLTEDGMWIIYLPNLQFEAARLLSFAPPEGAVTVAGFASLMTEKLKEQIEREPPAPCTVTSPVLPPSGGVSEQLLEATHRLEDRCVAAEEERNAAEARAQAEQRRREAAEARIQVLDSALDAAVLYRSAYDHKTIIGKRDKEEADKAIQKALCAGPHEDYVPTGPAALAPQERGGQEKGDTDG
jgi:hypothetical protein